MLCMRKLSYQYKLPSRSIAEVHERFEQSLLDHQKGRALMFQGRKLSAEAYANAVLLYFLDKPVEEQAAILQDYVSRFESMLEGGGAPATGPGHATKAVRVDVETGKPMRQGKNEKIG